jgi:hypothetical protein
LVPEAYFGLGFNVRQFKSRFILILIILLSLLPFRLLENVKRSVLVTFVIACNVGSRGSQIYPYYHRFINF